MSFYLLYSTDWKEKSDPQHFAKAVSIRSWPEHPRKVSFCPAADSSSESSPTADERTANFMGAEPEISRQLGNWESSSFSNDSDTDWQTGVEEMRELDLELDL